MLAHYRPAGEGNPRGKQGAHPQIEENVSVMNRIIKPSLGVIGKEKRIKNFPPKIGEPGERTPCNHGEDDGKSQKQVVHSLRKSKQCTDGHHLFLLLILLLLLLKWFVESFFAFHLISLYYLKVVISTLIIEKSMCVEVANKNYFDEMVLESFIC